jgi:hypothetical protein
VVSLFKMASQHSAEVISSASKGEEVVECLMESIHVNLVLLSHNIYVGA